MLQDKYRLRRMKDFEILFKEGRFFDSPLAQAKIWRIETGKYLRRNYGPEDLKIGFVVGVKIDKRAVVRNRLKRQMREVVRLLLKEDKIKNGYLIAFLAKPAIIGAEYKEIEKSITGILKKSGVSQ